MFQQNLTAPDTGAASAVTQGVIDRSGAMREMAKAQQYKDMTDFALTAMETGFKIDEHIQTKRLGEEMVDFKDQFAQEGLDAFSEEDMQYVQKFAGDLTAIQADQLREPIYKALIDKKFREATSRRPWLEDSLRSVAQKSTGKSFGDAVTNLSMEAMALKEKQALTQEKARAEQVDSFFTGMEEIFRKGYVQRAKLGMDLSKSPQEIERDFFSNPARELQFQNYQELRLLENQVKRVEANNKLSDIEKQQKLRSITNQMYSSGALDVNQITQTRLINLAESLSEDSAKLVVGMAEGRTNIYSILPEMSPEDLQKVSMALTNDMVGLRSQLNQLYEGNLPPNVQATLEQGQSYINLVEDFIKKEPAALVSAKNREAMANLQQSEDGRQFLQYIKETNRPLYNYFTLDKQLGASGGMIGAQLADSLNEAAKNFNQRVADNPDQVPGAVSNVYAKVGRFMDTSGMSNNQKIEAYSEISNNTLSGFLTPSSFKYQDLVDLSRTLSSMPENDIEAFMQSADPAVKDRAFKNINSAIEARIGSLNSRVRQNDSISFKLFNGRIGLDEDISRTGFIADPDVVRIRQDFNILRGQLMPLAIKLREGEETADQVLARLLGLTSTGSQSSADDIDNMLREAIRR